MREFFKRHRMRLLYFFIIVIGVLFDQFTKKLAVTHLKNAPAFPLWEGVLHFSYLENRGAAFGILQNQRWLFLTFSSVAILLLFAYLFYGVSYFSEKDAQGKYPPIAPLGGVALALIVSGGIGNMIDRIALGYVVDFIDFTLIDFAVFNVADSFVTVGAFMLALHLLIPLFRKKG